MRHLSKNKILNLGSLFLFLLVVTTVSLAAQEGTGKGRVSGVVVDEQGNPVRKAVGELVIRKPWIGMTRAFWNDKQSDLRSGSPFR